MQFQWPGILHPSFSVNLCQQTPTTCTLRSAIAISIPSVCRLSVTLVHPAQGATLFWDFLDDMVLRRLEGGLQRNVHCYLHKDVCAQQIRCLGDDQSHAPFSRPRAETGNASYSSGGNLPMAFRWRYKVKLGATVFWQNRKLVERWVRLTLCGVRFT